MGHSQGVRRCRRYDEDDLWVIARECAGADVSVARIYSVRFLYRSVSGCVGLTGVEVSARECVWVVRVHGRGGGGVCTRVYLGCVGFTGVKVSARECVWVV